MPFWKFSSSESRKIPSASHSCQSISTYSADQVSPFVQKVNGVITCVMSGNIDSIQANSRYGLVWLPEELLSLLFVGLNSGVIVFDNRYFEAVTGMPSAIRRMKRLS